ncbi:hypothetical protein LG198_11405 [Methylobacillus arboreus]|uniref:hypothetical protein n=1 Tax=Methylobacillus arboreus TaxID=755170 RepID=UPI001E549278|nr:hypothetical protein [Methylobacillus arboreus]MCB5191334.1 hypothetical protein [Methylobacillus arboreus]
MKNLISLMFATLMFHGATAFAVCKDYGNFKPESGNPVVGGVVFADYKQDKIDAYFYGEMCWTASEIAEEGNRRIFYKLISSHDANGRIAGYVPLAESASTMFTCPQGTVQAAADGYFDHIDGAKPGFHTLVCKTANTLPSP